MLTEPSLADAEEIERLRSRLAAAEVVCVLYGWSSGPGNSPDSSAEQKATLQAWMDWTHAYPDGMPDPQSESWKVRIAELAARRDEVRSTTLARIRGED